MGKYEKNPKIKLGDKDLLNPEYENPQEQKLRITAWIDGDIYDELNKRADAGEGKGRYQTLMNELLRSALFNSKPASFEVSVSQSLSKQGLDSNKVNAYLKTLIQNDPNPFGTLMSFFKDSVKETIREEMKAPAKGFQKYLKKNSGLVAKAKAKAAKKRA